jgi:hypothetical protein
MVTCLDDNVGRIVAALKDRGLAEGTLIVFSSDNGGPTCQGATNGELRGAKGGLYEGGVRVPAFAVWPGRIKPGTVVSEPLHMVDWYPTLAKLAGSSLEQKHPLDGRDVLPTIAEGKPTPHSDLLINVEHLWLLGEHRLLCGDSAKPGPAHLDQFLGSRPILLRQFVVFVFHNLARISATAAERACANAPSSPLCRGLNIGELETYRPVLILSVWASL